MPNLHSSAEPFEIQLCADPRTDAQDGRASQTVVRRQETIWLTWQSAGCNQSGHPGLQNESHG